MIWASLIGRFQQGPVGQAALPIISGYYRYGETVNGVNRGPRQLTSIVHRDCPGDLSNFDYDNAGRQVKEDTKVLNYDAFDQLTSVTTSGATTITNTYGFDGARTSTTSGGSSWR